MESLQDVVENWAAYCLEYLFLGALHVEHTVIHEWNFFGLGITDDELGAFADAVESGGVGVHFFPVEGSESAENFDVPLTFPIHE